MSSEIDNTAEIARAIFSKPPGEACSIQLELEEVTAEIATKRGVSNFVFNIVCTITYKGMEILFGHRDINRLSRGDFELLQRYIASFGYRIQVTANDSKLTPWDILDSGGVLQKYKVGFETIRG